MSDHDRPASRHSDDPRSTEELIRLAVTRQDQDEDPGWDAIRALRYRGTRDVLEAARRLCQSANPHEQAVGADILGQLGIPHRTFTKECLEILLTLLENGTDVEVLYSTAIALGHLGCTDEPRQVELLVALKDHPDADIRHSVVFGLLGQKDPLAIKTLIQLSSDACDEVRDWATFGLGAQIDLDTPEIREALYRRIEENDPSNAIGEAISGLARRKDERVIKLIIAALDAGDPGSLVFEAAEEFGDPRLLPALWRLKTQWDQSADISDQDRDLLNNALAHCEGSGRHSHGSPIG